MEFHAKRDNGRPPPGGPTGSARSSADPVKAPGGGGLLTLSGGVGCELDDEVGVQGRADSLQEGDRGDDAAGFQPGEGRLGHFGAGCEFGLGQSQGQARSRTAWPIRNARRASAYPSRYPSLSRRSAAIPLRGVRCGHQFTSRSNIW